MYKMLILTVFQRTQVTCAWSICSRICKNLGNIFQHWENPGFIQDLEQHVQDADLEEKTQVTCSWAICSRISKNIDNIFIIGKILVSSRIGKNAQDVDLDCFHGSKYALRCYLFIWSKTGKI